MLRLSEALWGIDYSMRFPVEIACAKRGGGLAGREGTETIVRVDVGESDEVEAFLAEHYERLFDVSEVDGFWTAPSTTARSRYLLHACDLFLFKDGASTIGHFIGNPTDWSTYYMRSCSFFPAYRGSALVHGFLGHLFEMLRAAGVARIEADTAPSNLGCVGAFVRQEFLVTGSVLSEQWGACTRFTKYLSASAQASFLDRFCRAGEAHLRGVRARKNDQHWDDETGLRRVGPRTRRKTSAGGGR